MYFTLKRATFATGLSPVSSDVDLARFRPEIPGLPYFSRIAATVPSETNGCRLRLNRRRSANRQEFYRQMAAH